MQNRQRNKRPPRERTAHERYDIVVRSSGDGFGGYKKKNGTRNIKYRKEAMSGFTLITVVFVIDIIFNLIMPIYKTNGFGVENISQWIMCGIIVWSYLKAMYYLDTGVLFLPITLVLLFEIVFHTFIYKSDPINWLCFGIVVLVDVIFQVFIVRDMASYDRLVLSEEEARKVRD